MRVLPRGRVVLCFSDVEGSTALAHRLGGSGWRDVLQTHRTLIREAVDAHGGVEVKSFGDGLLLAFADPVDAVRAVVDAQRALMEHPWPAAAEIRARMGLHVGTVEVDGDDYAGVEVHRAARVAAAAHGGQVLVSAALADAVSDGRHDVALRPLGRFRLRGLPEPELLHELVHPALPAGFPRPRVLPDHIPGLPATASPLVGRDAELRQVVAAVEGATVVTVVGPGGVGKTRLAAEAATVLGDRFGAGVVFVDLVPAHESGVAAAISAAVGLHESTVDGVAARLADQRLLLVLDNCEHLVAAAAAAVAAITAAAPDVRVLATSREPLRLAAEHVLPLAPLPVPATGAGSESVAACASVQLFADRARLVDPGFAATGSAESDVAEICRRLDGLPLALELAAARVGSLGLGELRRRLDDQLALLDRGPRDRHARQQTLRAALQWSIDLLGDAERTCLRRLSVFAGSFSPELAEAVSAADDIDARTVRDALESLADRSLVQRTAGGWRLLEVVRARAAELAAAAGDADATRRRLALELLRRTSGGAPDAVAAPGPWDASTHRFAREATADLRAGAAWAASVGDHPLALALLSRVQQVLAADAVIDRDLFAPVVAGLDHLPPGRLRVVMLRTAWRLAPPGEGDPFLDRAAREADELGDPWAVATAQVGVALRALQHGDADAAGAACRRIERAASDGDDPDAMVRAIHLRSVLRREDDALMETAYRAATRARDVTSRCIGLHYGARAAIARGRLDEARERAEEWLALALEAQVADQVGVAMVELAWIRWNQGDVDAAEATLRDALDVAVRAGVRSSELTCRKDLGLLALTRGDVVLARRHLTDAAATRIRLNAVECGATLAWLDLVEGDVRGARARLEPLLREEETLVGLPAMAGVRLACAAVDAATGAPHRALQGLVRALREHGRSSLWPYVDGLVVAARLGPDRLPADVVMTVVGALRRALAEPAAFARAFVDVDAVAAGARDRLDAGEADAAERKGSEMDLPDVADLVVAAAWEALEAPAAGR